MHFTTWKLEHGRILIKSISQFFYRPIELFSKEFLFRVNISAGSGCHLQVWSSDLEHTKAAFLNDFIGAKVGKIKFIDGGKT